MARPADPAARARILEAATRLFAERGYSGTTTRAIASELGINIATLSHHTGSKFDLFRAVLEQLYEEENTVLTALLPPPGGGAVDSREALAEILAAVASALIDLMVSRPERPRLYLRRWLDPDDEIKPFEVQISLKQHRPLRDLLETAKTRGLIDRAFPIDTFLRSFTWMICGYFSTGAIDWNKWFSDPLNDASLAELRRLVEFYIRRSLEEPWSSKKRR